MATDVERVLGGVTPLLMVSDPPYGVEYDPAWRNQAGAARTRRTGKVLNDDRADWREAWALFPGDVAYVWHGALHAATVAESLEAAGFAIRSQIIWAKERLVLSRGDYHWQHEPCWYAVKKTGKGHWAGDRKQTTLWQISSRDQDAETVHGTQKPVECMRRPILNNSSPGQAVYEPFMGSGTTLIAAETTGGSASGSSSTRPMSTSRSSVGSGSPARQRCSRARAKASPISRRSNAEAMCDLALHAAGVPGRIPGLPGFSLCARSGGLDLEPPAGTSARTRIRVYRLVPARCSLERHRVRRCA